MPIVNVQRRVDGNLVYGSVNEVTNEQNGETKPPQFNVPGAVAAPSNALLDSIGNLEVGRYLHFIYKSLFFLFNISQSQMILSKHYLIFRLKTNWLKPN